MRKILLIMPYGSVGGMERLALNFYNQYREDGYEVKAVKIIQLQSDIIHFGADEIALSTIDFNEMSFLKRFWFYIKIPFILRKIIKQNQITHSIAFGDMANVFSSLTFTKEFKIASIHALKSVEFTSKSFLNSVFKKAFQTSYRYFDKVVCISEAIQKDLLEKCNYKFPKNLQVIYNPHNIKQIELLAQEPLDSPFEEALFSKKVVLFLGRLSLQKAPWHLIKAFSLLQNEENSIQLVCIGDGDQHMTDYLDALIAKLQITKNVTFLGRKSNPYKYLKKASVLALSSYYEGTPNVIVEAIATETPIVSSNCTGGIVELMSVNEKKEVQNYIETESGIITPNFFKGSLLFPENDDFTDEESIFASALHAVMKDAQYQNRLISAKNILLDKFDLKRISSKYLIEIH